jgi:hypothetical protein
VSRKSYAKDSHTNISYYQAHTRILTAQRPSHSQPPRHPPKLSRLKRSSLLMRILQTGNQPDPIYFIMLLSEPISLSPLGFRSMSRSVAVYSKETQVKTCPSTLFFNLQNELGSIQISITVRTHTVILRRPVITRLFQRCLPQNMDGGFQHASHECMMLKA